MHRSVTNVLRYLKPPAIGSVSWYQFRINLKHVNNKENIDEMSLLGQRKITLMYQCNLNIFPEEIHFEICNRWCCSDKNQQGSHLALCRALFGSS